MGNQQNWLLAIEIGPVQDFIAAARKTRDLAYGSWLLSETSKAAALFLLGRRDADVQLIFPSSTEDLRSSLRKPEFLVTNKILAKVAITGEGGGTRMRAIVEECREAVRDNLVDRFRGIRPLDWLDSGIAYSGDIAITQIREVLEFYSAWVELQDGGEGYRASRIAVEKLLGARKGLRNFPRHQGSGRPKSSLDGIRESVIEHPKDKDHQYQRFAVRKGELLDAVGLLKRYGRDWKEMQFASTHDVAAMPFITSPRVRQSAELARYNRDLDSIESSDREFQHSYSYIYHSKEFGEKENPKTWASIEAAAKPLREMHPITPYYAVLVGDGDFMGRAIGRLDEPGHQEFSRKLSGFASEAKKEIRALGAEAVFAGGDDVVALLPLHVALECAIRVRQAFVESMGQFGATFSAGIAVCHAMDPLTESLRAAREAEQQAKKVKGKDALCITVVPRSGAEASACGKWDVVHPAVTTIAGLYESRKLSQNVVHDFSKLLGEWKLADDVTRDALDGHLQALANAIAEKKQTAVEALRLIERFFSRTDFNAAGVASQGPRETLTFLTNCLYVARPFARAMREAART